MMLKWIKELYELTCLARSAGNNVTYKIWGDTLEVNVLTRNPRSFFIPRRDDAEEQYKEAVTVLKELIKA